MRRCSLTTLAIAVTFAISLVVAAGAQAIVVNDQGTTAGVALVPGTCGDLLTTNTCASLTTAGVQRATSNAVCSDPWLSADFGPLPSNGLCYRGGAVMPRNETFALTWDPHRLYWQTTRDYIEQFLRDVADGTGTLTSPYAVTSQYADGVKDPSSSGAGANPTGPNPTGQARNASVYGGGCVDFGTVGGFSCNFGGASGAGHGYPNGNDGSCSVSGSLCVTDQDIKTEVSTIAQGTQLTSHAEPGYTPLVVVLVPAGVDVCLDGSGTLCSVNDSTAKVSFCSYHSYVVLPGGTKLAYVVQPWSKDTSCDEPSLPNLPQNPTPQQLSVDAGVRIVNPLSQGQIAAIVDPYLNGWIANNGSEINDNAGCVPEGPGDDAATVGNSSQNPYFLAPEFTNSGVIESDPNTYFGCAHNVIFTPAFVVPSAVNQGDEVQFDGSTTASTLLVPNAGYAWNFGDGTPTVVGPSVQHTYTKGGTYTVTLTVTDRGGDVRRLSQTIVVLGKSGQQVGGGSGGGGGSNPGLHVKLQIMPQGLKAMLHHGVAVRVGSNEAAAGIASVSISRATAKRAHIKGRGPAIVIGRGTLSNLQAGTVELHLRLSRAMTKRLGHLHRVTLTVRLALVDKSGDKLAIDAAGRY